jgi:rod shape-determining protein MreC
VKNLINFILKNTCWLLFFILVFLSIILIVNNNRFLRSKYLIVAQEVTGSVYSVSSNIESYINLRNTNADLMKKVAELENTVYAYKQRMESLADTNSVWKSAIDSLYTFTPARVVYNSVSSLENYIELDKGSNDGIGVDMGVMSSTGIVGVIVAVSPNYSLAIPVLNPIIPLSSKVKNNNYFGPLVWDGQDTRFAYLQELPRHINFEIGDTVVTSGYSTIFPEGLPIGTVVDSRKQKNDDYTSLKVKLFTNFNTLMDVLIINNKNKEEQKDLLKSANILSN